MNVSGIGPMLGACGMDFVIYHLEFGRCDIRLVAEMIASRGLSGARLQRRHVVDASYLAPAEWTR